MEAEAEVGVFHTRHELEEEFYLWAQGVDYSRTCHWDACHIDHTPVVVEVVEVHSSCRQDREVGTVLSLQEVAAHIDLDQEEEVLYDNHHSHEL